LYTVIS